jgi:electron transfer flavoprotein beta subunit
MNIVVCMKITPDPEDIEFRGGALSVERAEWVLSNFDLQALEAGMRLVEAGGGKVTVLSAGPKQINQSKLKKDVLSRGPDELVMIVDEALANADTAATSAVLAAAIRKMEGVDLVLCGEGSADLYFQQVGLQLGERLGLPTLNAIRKIEAGGAGLVLERDLEDEVEVLEVPLPAVLSVTTDINPPRLPSMKEILKAAKKPVTEWNLSDLGLGEIGQKTETLETRAPQQSNRKQVQIEGSAEDAARALAGYLRKEGIL